MAALAQFTFIELLGGDDSGAPHEPSSKPRSLRVTTPLEGACTAGVLLREWTAVLFFGGSVTD